MDKETKHFYEFGPFRVDPEKLLLLRNNEIVALPPKAFETLLVLVRHSETVVLKDDLMKSVWPDTFVEESNLAQNIFVLRKTLGETAGQNRYIATVPGRGYRFAEKVRLVPEQKEEEIVVQGRSITHVVIDERSSPSHMWLWAGAAAIALAALGGAWLWRSYNAPKLTDKDTVVLADFANTTGDFVFDGTLRQGLSAQLEQSPFLNLLSDRRTGQTLALMGQPKDARLTHELAQEVCQRAAAAAVLDGSIAQIGGRYLLTLRAQDCKSGEPLASAEAEANDKSQVLEALGKIASETRGKLGESLASVQKYDVRPQEVSTASLEALHSYSLAMKVRNGDFATCIPLFQRAIEQDPNFAMAYAQLGAVYMNIGETVRGVENLRKAYELRDHVSELEKFYIASHYDSLVTGDLAAARKDSELWSQIYPRDSGPTANLAVIYYYTGDFEKLLATVQESSALAGTKSNPHRVNPNTVWSFIFLNRLDEAKSMALEAPAVKLDDGIYHITLYVIDFLRRDFAGMKQEAAGLVGNPTWGDAVFYYEAATAAYFGHFAQAREFTLRAADFAEKVDKKQSAAIYVADAAIREALVGNSTLAREQAKSALAISGGKDVEAMCAIAVGLAGDSAAATQLANGLDKRFPQDTITQSNLLPTIRSAIELHEGNSAKAIQTLAAAAPYELGITALDAGMSLYPVYMRGEAYLAAKQGSAGAAEFQKILDHPGVVQNELIGALAHLGLGRAYVLSGDTGKAHAAYQEFFALWKDADSDIPILNQARAEYAKLQ
jgi:DNA-binding winged helix-turn-helix (wHTH) protein/tetratricopeptide (TPR) repeat protein